MLSQQRWPRWLHLHWRFFEDQPLGALVVSGNVAVPEKGEGSDWLLLSKRKPTGKERLPGLVR